MPGLPSDAGGVLPLPPYNAPPPPPPVPTPTLPNDDFMGGPLSNLPGAPGYEPGRLPVPINNYPEPYGPPVPPNMPQQPAAPPTPLELLFQELQKAGYKPEEIPNIIQKLSQPVQEPDPNDILGFARLERERIEREARAAAQEQAFKSVLDSGLDMPVKSQTLIDMEQQSVEAEQIARNREVDEKYNFLLGSIQDQIDSLTADEQAMVFASTDLDPQHIQELKAILAGRSQVANSSPQLKEWLDKNAENLRLKIVHSLAQSVADDGISVYSNLFGETGFTAALPRLSLKDFRDPESRDIYMRAQRRIAGLDDPKFHVDAFHDSADIPIDPSDVRNVLYNNGVVLTTPGPVMMAQVMKRYDLNPDPEQWDPEVQAYVEEHIGDYESLVGLDAGVIATVLNNRSHPSAQKMEDVKTLFGKVTFVKGDNVLHDKLVEMGVTEKQMADLDALFHDGVTNARHLYEDWASKKIISASKVVNSKVLDPIVTYKIGDISPLQLIPGGQKIPVLPDITLSDFGIDSLSDVGRLTGEALDKLSYPAEKHQQIVASLAVQAHGDDKKQAVLASVALGGILTAETVAAVAITARTGQLSFWPVVTATGAIALSGSTAATIGGSFTLDPLFLEEANYLSYDQQQELASVYASAMLLPGRDREIGERLREERLAANADKRKIDIKDIIDTEGSVADQAWLAIADPLNLIVPEAVMGGTFTEVMRNRKLAESMMEFTDKSKYVPIGKTPGSQGPSSILQGVSQFFPRVSVKVGDKTLASAPEGMGLMSKSGEIARRSEAVEDARETSMHSLKDVINVAADIDFSSENAQKTLWTTFKKAVAGGNHEAVDAIGPFLAKIRKPFLTDRKLEDLGGEILEGAAVEKEFPSIFGKRKVAPGRTVEEQEAFYKSLPLSERPKYFASAEHMAAEFASEYIAAATRRGLIRRGLDPDNLGAAAKVQALLKKPTSMFLQRPSFPIRNYLSGVIPAVLDDMGIPLSNMGPARALLNRLGGTGASAFRFAGASIADSDQLIDITEQKSTVKLIADMVFGGGFKQMLVGGGDKEQLSNFLTMWTRMAGRFEAGMGESIAARMAAEMIKADNKTLFEDVLPGFIDPTLAGVLKSKMRESMNAGELRRALTMELTGDGSWHIQRTWSVRDLLGPEVVDGRAMQSFLGQNPGWEDDVNSRLQDALEQLKNGEITRDEAAQVIRKELADVHGSVVAHMRTELSRIGIDPTTLGAEHLDKIIAQAHALHDAGKFDDFHSALVDVAQWSLSHIRTNHYTKMKMHELEEAAGTIQAYDVFIRHHAKVEEIKDEYRAAMKVFSDEQDALGLTTKLTEHEDEVLSINDQLSKRIVEIWATTPDGDEAVRLVDAANAEYGEKMRQAKEAAGENAQRDTVKGGKRSYIKKGPKGKKKPADAVKEAPKDYKRIPPEQYPDWIRIQKGRNETTLAFRQKMMDAIGEAEHEIRRLGDERLMNVQMRRKAFKNELIAEGKPTPVRYRTDLEKGDRVTVVQGTKEPATPFEIGDDVEYFVREFRTDDDLKMQLMRQLGTEILIQPDETVQTMRAPVNFRVPENPEERQKMFEGAMAKLGMMSWNDPTPANFEQLLPELSDPEIALLRRQSVRFSYEPTGTRYPSPYEFRTDQRVRADVIAKEQQRRIKQAKQAVPSGNTAEADALQRASAVDINPILEKLRKIPRGDVEAFKGGIENLTVSELAALKNYYDTPFPASLDARTLSILESRREVINDKWRRVWDFKDQLQVEQLPKRIDNMVPQRGVEPVRANKRKGIEGSKKVSAPEEMVLEYYVRGTITGVDPKTGVPMIKLKGLPEEVPAARATGITTKNNEFRNISRERNLYVPAGRYEVMESLTDVRTPEGGQMRTVGGEITLRNIITDQTITTNVGDLRSLKATRTRGPEFAGARGDVNFLFRIRSRIFSPEEIKLLKSIESNDPLVKALGGTTMTADERRILNGIREKLGPEFKNATRKRVLKAAEERLGDTKLLHERMREIAAGIPSVIDQSNPLKGAVTREEIARLIGDGPAPEDVPNVIESTFWNALLARNATNEVTSTLDDSLKAVTEPVKSYTPEEAKSLQESIDNAAKRIETRNQRALRAGMLARDNVLHNYENLTNMDQLLRWVFPWELWATRSAVKYGVRIADRPYAFSKMEQGWDFLSDQQADGKYWDDKVKIPFPFAGVLPSWLQGDKYTTFYNAFIPTDMISTYDNEEERQSTVGKLTYLSERAGLGMNPFVNYALRASGQMGPKAKNDIFGAQLPQEYLVNTFSHIGGAWIPALPQDLRYSASDYSRTRRMLYQMAVSGEISDLQAAEAMQELALIEEGKKANLVYIPGVGAIGGISTDNNALKIAMSRSSTSRMMTSELSAWTAFTLYDYSDASKSIDAAWRERSDIFKAEDTPERKQKLEEFYKEHPWMRVADTGKGLRESATTLGYARIDEVNKKYDTEYADAVAKNPLDPNLDAINAQRFKAIDEIWRQLAEESGLDKLPGDVGAKRDFDILTPGAVWKNFTEWAVDTKRKINSDEHFTYYDEYGKPYFDSVAWSKANESFLNSLPQTMRDEIEFTSRMNDMAPEAVRDVVKDIYSLARADMFAKAEGQSGAERAKTIKEYEDNWTPPSRHQIIKAIRERYGDQFSDSELSKLIPEALISLDASMDIKVDSQIKKLETTGVGFLAPSGEAVTTTNLEEFRTAAANRDEFLTQMNINPVAWTKYTTLWDEKVELFFGSGRAGSDLMRTERSMDIQITKAKEAKRFDEMNSLIEDKKQVTQARKLLDVPEEASATFPSIQENLNLYNYMKGVSEAAARDFINGRLSKDEYVNKVKKLTKAGLVVVDGVVITDPKEAAKVIEERKIAYENSSPDRSSGGDTPSTGEGGTDTNTKVKYTLEEIIAEPNFFAFKVALIEKSFQPGDDVPGDKTAALLMKNGADNHFEIQRLFKDMYDMTQLDRESALATEIRRLPHVKSALFGLSQLRITTATLIMAIDDMLKLFDGDPIFKEMPVPTASEFGAKFAKSVGVEPVESDRATQALGVTRARTAVAQSQRRENAAYGTNFAYGAHSWADVTRTAATLFGLKGKDLIDGLVQSFNSGRELSPELLRRARFMATVSPVEGATSFKQWLLGMELIYQTDSLGAPSPPVAPSSGSGNRSRFPLAIRERRF